MAWFFKPLNDICVDCNVAINPCHERNYIVWDSKSTVMLYGKKKRGAYRRQCAACYDRAHQRPYERKKSTDTIIHSTLPEAPKPELELPVLQGD